MNTQPDSDTIELLATTVDRLPPHGISPSKIKFPTLPEGTASVQEIFSSIQGEGLYAGVRQVFVRLSHCHLQCAYCDTPMTTPDGNTLLEAVPGSHDWLSVPGLQFAQDTEMYIAGLLNHAPHHSVSFTGGEPLLYATYLKQVFPLIKQLGLKTFLETSGTQPHLLAVVLQDTDIISMDLKLPSSTKTAAMWDQHLAFYRTAVSQPDVTVYAKCVVNNDTSVEELSNILQVISDRNCFIYLQPETSLTANLLNITSFKLLELQAYLSRHYVNTRVLPQTHKFMNMA